MGNAINGLQQSIQNSFVNFRQARTPARESADAQQVEREAQTAGAGRLAEPIDPQGPRLDPVVQRPVEDAANVELSGNDARRGLTARLGEATQRLSGAQLAVQTVQQGNEGIERLARLADDAEDALDIGDRAEVTRLQAEADGVRADLREIDQSDEVQTARRREDTRREVEPSRQPGIVDSERQIEAARARDTRQEQAVEDTNREARAEARVDDAEARAAAIQADPSAEETAPEEPSTLALQPQPLDRSANRELRAANAAREVASAERDLAAEEQAVAQRGPAEGPPPPQAATPQAGGGLAPEAVDAAGQSLRNAPEPVFEPRTVDLESREGVTETRDAIGEASARGQQLEQQVVRFRDEAAADVRGTTEAFRATTPETSDPDRSAFANREQAQEVAREAARSTVEDPTGALSRQPFVTVEAALRLLS